MKSGRPFKVGDNVTSKRRPGRYGPGRGVIVAIVRDWFGKAARVRWLRENTEQLCLCSDLRHVPPGVR